MNVQQLNALDAESFKATFDRAHRRVVGVVRAVGQATALRLQDHAFREVGALTQCPADDLLSFRVEVQRSGVNQADALLKGSPDHPHCQILVEMASSVAILGGSHPDEGGSDAERGDLDLRLAQGLAWYLVG